MCSPPGLVDATIRAIPIAGVDFSPWRIAMLIGLCICGVIAGVINSFAAGGSFLTLPMLVAAGVPPSMANGTNRIAVLLQNVAATVSFRTSGVREEKAALQVFVPLALGSILGAYGATQISDAVMRPLLGVLLLAWGGYLWKYPGSFREPAAEVSAPGWRAHGISFAIGLYGGFVQAGVGFALLALLVSVLGHDAVRANAIKVLCVLGLTALALPVFVYYGQVVWIEGLALALGTIIGGWLGAKWQIDSGRETIHKVILAAIAVSGAALLIDGVLRFINP